MATAIVSALSGRPVRHDVAMTGEITLSGRVLPIGGLKEKVLGAVRAGITHIVIPRDNEADLDDLPEEVRDTIEVHGVVDAGGGARDHAARHDAGGRTPPVRRGARGEGHHAVRRIRGSNQTAGRKACRFYFRRAVPASRSHRP